MLKEHRELMAAIEAAEAAATALYGKGEAVGDTIRLLRQAGNQIGERVKHYQQQAAKGKEQSAKGEEKVKGRDKDE